jgi:hypothetical protein
MNEQKTDFKIYTEDYIGKETLSAKLQFVVNCLNEDYQNYVNWEILSKDINKYLRYQEIFQRWETIKSSDPTNISCCLEDDGFEVYGKYYQNLDEVESAIKLRVFA